MSIQSLLTFLTTEWTTPYLHARWLSLRLWVLLTTSRTDINWLRVLRWLLCRSLLSVCMLQQSFQLSRTPPLCSRSSWTPLLNLLREWFCGPQAACVTNPNAAQHAEQNKKITFSFTINFSFYINLNMYLNIINVFLCKIILFSYIIFRHEQINVMHLTNTYKRTLWKNLIQIVISSH